MKTVEKNCKYYSELFFKILLKKAYRKVDLRQIKIVHNISETGTLNIIATDGHYNYDIYISEIEYQNKPTKVFAISRYSEYSSFSDSKLFNQETFELIQ